MMKTNKQLPLVTFEQAQRLKKAGFDWTTTPYYTFSGLLVDRLARKEKMANGKYPTFFAPTVSLALKWIRDVKNIVCGVHVRDNRARGDAPYIGVYERGDNESFYASDSVNHTHEATESALLDELLTLIEK